MIGCLIVLAIMALKFLVTVGIIYLITLCFGLTFSWKISIGIWLIISILRTVFK